MQIGPPGATRSPRVGPFGTRGAREQTLVLGRSEIRVHRGQPSWGASAAAACSGVSRLLRTDQLAVKGRYSGDSKRVRSPCPG
jgi:hypothetical protein